MTTLYESAFAKLNLTLDVLDRRPDGYHNIRSVMQTISLCDDLTLTVGTGKPWRLLCDKAWIPTDERNLAWRAAEVYCGAADFDPGGLEIRIEKHIPAQAGMGGGSADAAAVLRALNRYLGEPLPLPALAELGARIGSDVPFCVVGGTYMCEGRGERLRPLPAFPDCGIVVCKPAFSVSTPELYARVDAAALKERPDQLAMEQALRENNLEKAAHSLMNVFDALVAQEHPEMNFVKSVFHRYGALGCQMTGTGSACYAIVPGETQAVSMCDELRDICPDVFICKPV